MSTHEAKFVVIVTITGDSGLFGDHHRSIVAASIAAHRGPYPTSIHYKTNRNITSTTAHGAERHKAQAVVLTGAAAARRLQYE